MEISVEAVLTICLLVSIYAHIWSYLSVCVHFMPIYGDSCRTCIDHLFAEPFVLVPENRVSDRVEAGYCTT